MKLLGIRGIITVSVIATIVLFLSICIQQYFLDEDIPNLIDIKEGMTFDYIVVGSGTAGSVVASKLARCSKYSVLLIEAGDKFGRLSKIPLLATFMQQTKNDWRFLSAPQKFSSRGLIQKQQSLPRGKGLGGSSQINYLLHFDGIRKDFDIWKKHGATEWSYDQMKDYLKNIEPYVQKSNLPADCYNSMESSSASSLNQTIPVQTNKIIWTIPKNYSLLTEAFEKAKFEFIGKKLNFQRSQYNIKNGERYSVYQMYLKPSFELENFKILLKAHVERISFKKNHAKSVFIRNHNGEMITINSNKEIILSAGAYGTPQILQLSGIGPKKVLDSINVESIVESSNVGGNLFEHLNLPLYVSINESASLTFGKIISPKEIWNYYRKGKGAFSNFGVLGNVRKINENYGITLFGVGSIDESSLKSLSNFKTKTFRSLFPLYHHKNQEGFVLLCSCYHPLSRGTVQAISRTTNYPLIDLNLLSNPNDIKCIIKAIRTAVDIVLSKSFRKLNPTIHWPILHECLEHGPYREDLITNKPSNKYLECLIRTVALSSHHPGGTCAIGNNSKSCIDNTLKVRGVTGLRVIDASVFPAPISGTPNSVLIAIAKRAVDLILNDT